MLDSHSREQINPLITVRYMRWTHSRGNDHFYENVISDELVKSQKCPRIVTPVKTGIQRF